MNTRSSYPRTFSPPYPPVFSPSYLLTFFPSCLLLLSLSACERAFVEVQRPAIEVVTPDVHTVLGEPSTLVAVSASSFRSIRRVELNGEAMTRDGSLWKDTLALRRGLNRLVITAFDVEGVTGTDTASVVYLPVRSMPAPASLPSPRGGHAATLLADSSLLVTGGTLTLNRYAEGDAYRLPAEGDAFERLPAEMVAPRTGHTASLLPDGRVLILGGSRTDPVSNLSALVETAELFDPETGRFEPVPFRGPPIRRAFHTASVHTSGGTPTIDLFGGRGDIRYGSSPHLGFRDDLRSFVFRNDSLIAVQAFPIGPRPDVAGRVSGHTQTLLEPVAPSGAGRYLIAGSDFAGDSFNGTISFTLDYTRAGLADFDRAAAPFILPRTRHAAARVEPGIVAFFGGHRGHPSRLVETPELYAEEVGRMYRFSGAWSVVKRFGHTATKLPSERILLLGGFNARGNGLRFGEYVTFPDDS